MRGLAILIALGVGACSSSGSDSSRGNGANDGSARDGGGTIFGSGSDGGSAFGHRPVGADAACAAETLKAERIPLDLYVMMDSSASMLEKLPDGTVKWDGIKSAMSQFFSDPDSAQIDVGLGFFPAISKSAPRTCSADSDCGAFGPCYGIRTCTTPYTSLCDTAADCASGQSCIPIGYCQSTGKFCTPVGSPCGTGDTCTEGLIEGYCLGRDSCTTSDYATPAVPISSLPDTSSSLDAALSAVTPDGYTPTAGALAGALDYARARTKDAPGHAVAVVLATDGLPTECDPKDIGGVAAIAGKALAETPSIRTYVVGIFSSSEKNAASNLNSIAAAGGSQTAHIVNTDKDVSRSFLDALGAIRNTALLCEYTIPTPKGPIDYGAVNVQYKKSGGDSSLVPYVEHASGCSASEGGWYYDTKPGGNGSPTKVISCSKTCDNLKSGSVGQIDIVYGCATVRLR